MVGDEELLTRVDRPGARAAPPQGDTAPVTRPSAPSLARSSIGGSSSTTVGSPLAVLARDEILRTRMFCYMGFVIAAVALSAIPFLPGGYWETRILVVGISCAVVGLVYLFHRTRTPETFHGFGAAIGWYIPALGVDAATPYFGPYSPVAILFVLGIYFTALGQSRRLALALYVTFAVTQGACGVLAILGVADPGIFRGDYLPTSVQIIAQLLVQMILAATYFIARASRRSQLIAIGELEAAIRAVAQREALLQEAREELRRALGGGRGRFTEQTIGHYRLGDLIGRGAMGEVYEGVDTRSEEPVAVKMLSSTSLGNAQHVQRFLRELTTAAALRSPHIVRVIEVGDEPLPHLVMERLRGRDLSTILRERRVLPEAELVDLIRQIGDGITAAGAAGVIHRDLKPQNVFLAEGTWKILDFGVSRVTDTGDTLTAGQLVGTPAYMAPEQASGGEVTHASDLYALAAIAYRCVTGHAPFASGEIHDVLYRVVHTRPRRPSSLAKVSPELELVLAIGLAGKPRDRFATATELADAIAAAVDGGISETLRARALRVGSWA
jgi:eukaryotic-like serine/threonine-protein kinase